VPEGRGGIKLEVFLARRAMRSYNTDGWLAGGEAMKSSVLKRSIVITGHKTSVSLEDRFWDSLKEIADERGVTLGALVTAIDGNRQHANLSSAIRLFVLGVYRDQASLKRVDAPIDGVRPL
jgi:predicted DNA-binding ribbon-helix-helix protein